MHSTHHRIWKSLHVALGFVHVLVVQLVTEAPKDAIVLIPAHKRQENATERTPQQHSHRHCRLFSHSTLIKYVLPPTDRKMETPRHTHQNPHQKKRHSATTTEAHQTTSDHIRPHHSSFKKTTAQHPSSSNIQMLVYRNRKKKTFLQNELIFRFFFCFVLVRTPRWDENLLCVKKKLGLRLGNCVEFFLFRHNTQSTVAHTRAYSDAQFCCSWTARFSHNARFSADSSSSSCASSSSSLSKNICH